MPATLLQSCLTLCDSMKAAHQAPLSTGLFRQEYWSGLPFPSPFTSLRTCKHGELVTLAAPKGPGNPACLCRHAHRCVRLGDTTFYKNHRLCLIRAVGLWIPEDLKQVHMAPRTEEAARAQAAMAVGQVLLCAGGSGPIKAIIPAKDPEAESLSFKIFKCTLKKRRRKKIEGLFGIPAGLKAPLVSKLGKFQLQSNQKIPKQRRCYFQEIAPKMAYLVNSHPTGLLPKLPSQQTSLLKQLLKKY